MSNQYFVYLTTNRPRGVLYTGITNDLLKRVWQHKQKVVLGFTAKYNLDKLAYYEVHDDVSEAIKREKQVKNLLRKKKIEMIEKENPEWKDLYEDLLR